MALLRRIWQTDTRKWNYKLCKRHATWIWGEWNFTYDLDSKTYRTKLGRQKRRYEDNIKYFKESDEGQFTQLYWEGACEGGNKH